jgi:hypothetical protein
LGGNRSRHWTDVIEPARPSRACTIRRPADQSVKALRMLRKRLLRGTTAAAAIMARTSLVAAQPDRWGAGKGYSTGRSNGSMARGTTMRGGAHRENGANWNRRREDQGLYFNYSVLCALTGGMVIRRTTGHPLSVFAEEALWQPLGAEAQAAWLTGSGHDEFNCIGVPRPAARLGEAWDACRSSSDGAPILRCR